MVDTLLSKEEDGDVHGLDRCIGIAIAGDPKHFCPLPALHGEMLGERRVLKGIMLEILWKSVITKSQNIAVSHNAIEKV